MNNAKTTRCKANHPMICLSEPSSIDHRQSFGALCDASSRSLSYFNHSILFNSYFIFYFIHFTVFLTVLTGARLPDEILWWLILYNANRHRLCHTIEGSINHACDPSPADGREVRPLESEELPISPSLLLTPSLPLTTASLSSSSSPSSCLRAPATSLWRSARRCSPWKGRTSARCVVPHRPLAHPPTRPLDVLTPSFHVPRSRHQFATKGVYQKELKAARAAGLRPEFTGHGTAYSNAVPDASGFACSNRQIPPAAEENFAAINVNQWENGAHCGECVEVWCEDAFCPTRFQPQVLKVYDLCPECKHGDLDLSFEAYEKVTGRWPHRLKIGWRWLSREQCNEYFDVGTRIRMDLKDHNKWYRGFYFSMLAERLESVKLNGRELTPRAGTLFPIFRACPWSVSDVGHRPHGIGYRV